MTENEELNDGVVKLADLNAEYAIYNELAQRQRSLLATTEQELNRIQLERFFASGVLSKVEFVMTSENYGDGFRLSGKIEGDYSKDFSSLKTDFGCEIFITEFLGKSFSEYWLQLKFQSIDDMVKFVKEHKLQLDERSVSNVLQNLANGAIAKINMYNDIAEVAKKGTRLLFLKQEPSISESMAWA